MASENPVQKGSVLELVEQKIESIKKAGFGEVKIVIRNGAVYRIVSTRDELVDKR